jgi:hypothetical protein
MHSSSAHFPPTSAAPRRLLLAFMLTTVLVPATILNKILFVMLMIWTLRLMVLSPGLRPRLSMPALCAIAIFLYGLLLCLPAHNDNALAIQFFLSTFVLLLIHFIDQFDIDMDLAVETCGRAILLTTALYWILALNPDLPFASQTLRWFEDASQSATAEREYLEDPTLTLALGSAPFLFVPWCVVVLRFFRTRSTVDIAWLLAYGAAITLSGARGIIAVALAFLAIGALWLTSPRTRIVVVVVLTAALAISVPFVLTTTSLFSSDEVSNAAKIGHFKSFIDILDLRGAVFGNGLGSYYFSSGSGYITPHTELTPIDLARYVGIPLAIMFYALLLLPRNSLSAYRGEHFLFYLGFGLYLVLSITNPVLINSYGMLVVLWYWAKLQAPLAPEPSLHAAADPAARRLARPGAPS